MKKYIIVGGVTLIGAFLLLALTTYWFIFGLDSWLLRRDLERPVDQRLLFIGNSFTYQNDLDKMVSELLERQAASRVFSTKVAFGGYQLLDHLEDIVDNDIESPIRNLLVDGSAEIKDWDLVVLQEQVETPGLDSFEHQKATSIDSAHSLGSFAHKAGAEVMLMETWGSAFDPNDPNNPYPEFPILQQQLSDINQDIVAVLKAGGIEATMTPAGSAFLIVYEDDIKLGNSPMTDGSRFLSLYSEDRRHASLAGTYLAAAVVTASYTQAPISSTEWYPLGIDAEFAQYLRGVADQAVFGSEQ